jgi:hypothetical protein
MIFITRLKLIVTFVCIVTECTIAFTSPSCMSIRRLAFYPTPVRSMNRYTTTVNRSFRIHSANNEDNILNDEEPTKISSSSDSVTSRRKKRVRRKDTIDEPISMVSSNSIQPPPPPIQQQIALKPREDSRVTIKVTDIRELTQTENEGISNKKNSPSISAPDFIASRTSKPSIDDDRTASRNKFTKSTSLISNGDGDDVDYESMDPIQRMLFDAKQMQLDEKTSNNDGANNQQSDSSESSIGSRIRGVVSTIVTIDFFIVCGFLLWFLAGIFSSYILKVKEQIMSMQSPFLFLALVSSNQILSSFFFVMIIT